jgi:hypothetical protein
VKLARLLLRIALLSLAATAFVGLTGIYGSSARPTLPNPLSQAERRHRPAAPNVSEFPEFVAGVVEVALFALMGRIVFRIRLSSVPRSEEKLIFLDLHPGRVLASHESLPRN